MMYNYSDMECVAMLRMKRVPFFSLCNLLRTRKLVPETVGCPVEEQVAMFIHVVGHNQRFRVVHQSFRRSIETVSRIFHQVLFAIGELRAEMIKPPSTVTHPKIMGSHRWFPFLKVY
jgi:predicted chitinase